MAAAACATALLWAPASVGVQTQTGRVFYVSPGGSSSNDGSMDRPLDMATALSSSSPARAGDRIWVRGGRYVGPFVSRLAGSSSAPIIVRAYGRERATIDNGSATTPALSVYGSDTWYWGLEVTDSHPTRIVTGGYNPPRSTSVWVNGPRTKFINMVVHDGEQGFGLWSPAVDSELYGNLIYYVGFDSDNRGHGHSIYVQNEVGSKRIVDNVLHHGYSYGLHGYTENGFLNNLYIEGNISYNHATMSAQGWTTSNYLLRGKRTVSQSPVFKSNVGYYGSPGGRNIDISAAADNSCVDMTMTDNWWVGVPQYALFGACQSTRELARNVVIGEAYPGDYATRYPNNTWLSKLPTSGVAVRVRPNQYEPGRSNIAILNYDLRSVVNVDLSGTGLANGTEFEIRDAMNFYGAPVYHGTYVGQPVPVSMYGLVPGTPVGNILTHPRHSAPQFGAFIVVPGVGVGTGPEPDNGPVVPTASLTATPAATSTGSSSTLIWSTSNSSEVSIDRGIGAVAANGSMVVTPTTTTTYTLTARNAAGTASASATVTVSPAPGGGGSVANRAAFLGADTASQGAWKNKYGREGYVLAQDAANVPAFAQLTLGGQPYTWAASTLDRRALERATSTTRVAAMWWGEVMTLDLALTDGRSHQVGMYLVDWEARGRTQTIEVLDASTGAMLDTRNLSNFRDGHYLLWTVEGRVRFRLIRRGPLNSVVSGIFFDPSDQAPNSTPTASLTAEATTKTAPGIVALRADLTNQASVRSVSFYAGSTLLSTKTAGPYAHTWTDVPAGTHVLTARALDSRNTIISSAPVSVTIAPAAPSAPATLTLSTNNASFTAPATVELTAAASNSSISQVSFYNGSTLLGSDASRPFTFTWSGVTAGTFALTARATDDRGRAIASAPVSIAVAMPSEGGGSDGDVSFIKSDTTTQGNWRGVYGRTGYILAQDATSLPSYVQVSMTGQAPYTWVANTVDTRALMRASSSSRLAAMWWGETFTIDVNFTDNQRHQVSLYMVDWDARSRAQTIEVIDPSTGEVLVSKLSDFRNGQYLVWQVSGAVRFRLLRTGWMNAVVSGIFID